MTPRSAYTLFLVFGFVLVLVAIGWALHTGRYDTLPIRLLGGLGLYLLLTNFWAHALTRGPDVFEPPLGAGVHAAVLGFLLVLGLVTLHLSGHSPQPAVKLGVAIPAGLLLVLGFAVSLGNRPQRPRYTAAMSTGAVQGDGRYGMSPHGACTLFVALGTLMILYAVAHALHFATFDATLVWTLAGVGLFLILLATLLLRKTGVVRVIRPYPHLAGATLLAVLGFGLILGRVTLELMRLPIDPQQGRILLIVGGLLIALGLLLNSGGRQVVRLAPA